MLKSLLICFTSLISSKVFCQKSISKGHMEIIISKIDIAQGGIVWIGIYNSKKNHMNNTKSYKSLKILANKRKKTYLLKNIPIGNYSISIFHDANENKLLDTNFIGIPKEGYGFSNNPNSFGIPSFKKSQVSIKKDTTTKVNIILIY